MADIYTALLAYTDPTVPGPTVGRADSRVKNYLQRMAARNSKSLMAAMAAQDEVTDIAQHVATVSGGNYTLTVNATVNDIVYTTANITWNATAATIEAALDTASPATVGDGDITVAEAGSAGLSDGNCSFTCDGNLAEVPVLITINDVNLSGGGTVGAITRTTAGQPDRPAGQALTELLAVTGLTQDAGEEPTLVDNTANAVGWVDRPSLRVIKWLGKAVAVEEGTPYVNDQLEALFPEIVNIR